MEFKQAMRVIKRICAARDDCEKCELELNFPFVTVPSDHDYGTAESILTRWAAEHPERTIADDFFKKFPNAPRDNRGDPIPCASDCGFSKPSYCGCGPDSCGDCWRRPLEEVE